MKQKTFLAGLILAGAVSFSGTAFAENNVTALKTAEIKSGVKLAVSANIRDSVNVMRIHDVPRDPKGHILPPPPPPGHEPHPIPPKPGHNPPDIHRPRPPKPDYHDYDYGRRPHPDEMRRPPKDYRPAPAPHMHMPPPMRDHHPEDVPPPPPPHKDYRPPKP